ncbi:MAG: hypothetical protein Q9195_003731 [Heterodermia aff. obscurata]
MAPDAEQLMVDSTLTSVDSQYDDHLGTQIPLDIADIPGPSEDDLVMETLDAADGQTTQVIDLCKSDGAQDAMNVEDDSDLRVKTEESDVPFVWTDMGSDIIELSDSNEEEVQEMSLTQMRSSRSSSNNHSSEVSISARGHGSGKITGAGAIFRDFRGQAPRLTEPTDIDDDDSDFSDRGVSSRCLKRKYRAKSRNGKVDEEDEISLLAATEKEQARLKRVEADRLLRNRALAASKHRSAKRVKHGRPKKRPNRKSLQAQEEAAMRAGLEEYLAHGNGEIEEESGLRSRAKKKSQSKKGLSKAPGAKASTLKNRVTNIGSLGSRISTADAASADRPALAVDNAKTKNMALKALLAGVPLEGQREARSDRAKILRASRLLGFRMVSPDGLGAWKLKGMATHLYNHQVIASGFMPLGGLLADEMGLGKTVEIIATMVANPPAEDEENRCTLIVAPSGLVNQWMAELTKHCEPRFFKRIFRYDATSKFRGEGVEYIMQEADVV